MSFGGGIPGAYAEDWPEDERSESEIVDSGNKYLKRAEKLALMGREEDARESARMAIGQYKSVLGCGYDDMSVHKSLFHAYYFLGETDKAREHLEKSIELDRDGLAKYMETDEYREYGARFRIAHLEAKAGWLDRMAEGCIRGFQDINSRPSVFAFDLDGTLLEIDGYAWDMIDRELGTEGVSVELKKMYKSGMFPYEEWPDMKLHIYSSLGFDREMFDRLFSGVNVSEGAVETLQGLKELGAKAALISGSFDNLLEGRIPRELFCYIAAHSLVFGDDGSLENWEINPNGDGAGKAEALLEVKRMLKWESGRPYVAYVGDNENDIEAFKRSDLAIAYRPRTERVRAAADMVIEDLREIMDFAGRYERASGGIEGI